MAIHLSMHWIDFKCCIFSSICFWWFGKFVVCIGTTIRIHLYSVHNGDWIHPTEMYWETFLGIPWSLWKMWVLSLFGFVDKLHLSHTVWPIPKMTPRISLKTDPSKFIETAEQHSKWITKILFDYTVIGWCIAILTLLGLSFIFCLIKHGHADPSHLFYVFHHLWDNANRTFNVDNHLIEIFRWPWNQHSIRGWFLEIIVTFIIAPPYLIINGAFLAFFVTIHEYNFAFYEYFCSLTENEPQGQHSLKELIRFHILIRGWVDNIIWSTV